MEAVVRPHTCTTCTGRYTRGGYATRKVGKGGGRASSLFGFVPSVSVAIPPPTGRRTIAPKTTEIGEGGGEATDTLGRPRNSFWWLLVGILIFLVLCQTGRASYLYDDQPPPAGVIGLFLVLRFGGLLADRSAGMMARAAAIAAAAVIASGTGRVLYRFKQSSFRNRHQWQGQCCHVLTSGACPAG